MEWSEAWRRVLVAVACAALIALLWVALPAAAAAGPGAFWTRCVADAAEDVACANPRGIAASPLNGHVYVGDQQNKRVVEFDAWGRFVRTIGWKVNKTKVESGVASEAEENLCPIDPGDVCQAGTTSNAAGRGRFASTQGIAIDSAGDVYVVDRPNRRVQKFDSEGHFLLMFGKGVNETSGGDLCPRPAFPGDTCKAGEIGEGAGEFGEWTVSRLLHHRRHPQHPLGRRRHRLHRRQGTDPALRRERGTAGRREDPEGLLSRKKVRSLAVVPSGGASPPTDAGRLFMVREGTAGVVQLDPSGGAKQCEAAVAEPLAVGTDAAGDAYVKDQVAGHPVRKLGPGCEEVVDSEFPFEDGFDESYGIATGSACLSEGLDLYVDNNEGSGVNSFLRAYGPAPDRFTGIGEVCEAPLKPPRIADQLASSVEYEGAVLEAKINPEFWEDTTYHVEYGTGKCSEGGCPHEQPLAPGPRLTDSVGDEALPTPPIALSGLAPGTTYHFRFVSQSSGGGPSTARTQTAKAPEKRASPKGEKGSSTPTRSPARRPPAPTTPTARASAPACPTAGPTSWSARWTRTAATSTPTNTKASTQTSNS